MTSIERRRLSPRGEARGTKFGNIFVAGQMWGLLAILMGIVVSGQPNGGTSTGAIGLGVTASQNNFERPLSRSSNPGGNPASGEQSRPGRGAGGVTENDSQPQRSKLSEALTYGTGKRAKRPGSLPINQISLPSISGRGYRERPNIGPEPDHTGASRSEDSASELRRASSKGDHGRLDGNRHREYQGEYPVGAINLVMSKNPVGATNSVMRENPRRESEMMMRENPVGAIDLVMRENPRRESEMMMRENPVGASSLVMRENPRRATGMMMRENSVGATNLVMKENPRRESEMMMRENPVGASSLVMRENPRRASEMVSEESPLHGSDIEMEEGPLRGSKPVTGVSWKKALARTYHSESSGSEQERASRKWGQNRDHEDQGHNRVGGSTMVRDRSPLRASEIVTGVSYLKDLARDYQLERLRSERHLARRPSWNKKV